MKSFRIRLPHLLCLSGAPLCTQERVCSAAENCCACCRRPLQLMSSVLMLLDPLPAAPVPPAAPDPMHKLLLPKQCAAPLLLHQTLCIRSWSPSNVLLHSCCTRPYASDPGPQAMCCSPPAAPDPMHQILVPRFCAAPALFCCSCCASPLWSSCPLAACGRSGNGS